MRKQTVFSAYKLQPKHIRVLFVVSCLWVTFDAITVNIPWPERNAGNTVLDRRVMGDGKVPHMINHFMQR
jgi:hypothetical protein